MIPCPLSGGPGCYSRCAEHVISSQTHRLHFLAWRVRAWLRAPSSWSKALLRHRGLKLVLAVDTQRQDATRSPPLLPDQGHPFRPGWAVPHLRRESMTGLALLYRLRGSRRSHATAAEAGLLRRGPLSRRQGRLTPSSPRWHPWASSQGDRCLPAEVVRHRSPAWVGLPLETQSGR